MCGIYRKFTKDSKKSSSWSWHISLSLRPAQYYKTCLCKDQRIRLCWAAKKKLSQIRLTCCRRKICGQGVADDDDGVHPFLLKCTGAVAKDVRKDLCKGAGNCEKESKQLHFLGVTFRLCNFGISKYPTITLELPGNNCAYPRSHKHYQKFRELSFCSVISFNIITLACSHWGLGGGESTLDNFTRSLNFAGSDVGSYKKLVLKILSKAVRKKWVRVLRRAQYLWK